MIRIAATLALTLALAAPHPLRAEEAPAAPPEGGIAEGADLIDRGARLLLRGLMAELEPGLSDLGAAVTEMGPALAEIAAMIGDIRNYHAPERMPNGDIILRRRADPPPDPDPPAEGEIDL